MPDLLILSDDNKSCSDLKQLCEDQGFRVKWTFDIGMAFQWLDTLHFEIIIVPASLDLEKQQQIAGKLWNKNPIAIFILEDIRGDSNLDPRRAKLFGAEILKGSDWGEKLTGYLEIAKPKGSIAQSNFGILVVEDLDSPLHIICSYIESLGFPNVHGVTSAKAALQLLETDPERFSCVVTDIKMPEISGQKLIESVRSHKNLSKIPIIVLTAYGTSDCLIDCLKAGASGFLVKPPKKRDLTRELSRAFRLYRVAASPILAAPDEVDLIQEMLLDRDLGD